MPDEGPFGASLADDEGAAAAAALLVQGTIAHPVIAHFYRAVVAHGDVWRQRMDATTNWAAATTAGMITVAFGTPATPHVLLLLSLAFDVVFLLMESRRYQVYDLWRRRFRTLNQHLVAPVLLGEQAARATEVRRGLASVAEDLGGTVPHLSLPAAMGFRIRRNYAYLFGIATLAWGIKLELHPVPAPDLAAVLQRAAVGTVPGAWIVLAVAAFLLAALALALRAPTEQMVRWSEVPSPYDRLLERSRDMTPWGRTGRRPGARPGGPAGS